MSHKEQHSSAYDQDNECDVTKKRASNITSAVLALLKNEELRILVNEKIIDPYLRKKRHVDKSAIDYYKLPIIIALISALLAWDGVNSRLVVDEADEQIKVFNSWMKNIDNSIIDMREANKEARSRVKAGEPLDKKEFNIKRSAYLAEIAKANIGVGRDTNEGQNIGGDIDRAVYLLNLFDLSIDDIFNKSAPGDYAWQYYQTRVDYLIGLKIQEQKKITIRAKKFILRRLYEDIKSLLSNAI